MSQSQPEFPVGVLPERVFHFVLEARDALDVDYSLIAGPCLAALAGCIGNRRRIVVKPGSWTEAAVLWVAIVLRSGGKKTPAIGLVLEHLHKRQDAEIKAAKARQAEYEEQIRGNHRPTGEPKPTERFLVSDITTEALLSVHEVAPLGLLAHRDELGGWLRSYNQYKGGKGTDAQTWSEMHQGKPVLVDRKGSGTLSVQRAAVSIVGGIQPELLRTTLSGEHLYDGIASRILFVVPEERLAKWTEATVSNEALEGWAELLDELLELQPDEDGNPIDLPMTSEAKAAWVRYHDDHAQREADANGPYRSALSKLRATTARLALVMRLAEDPQSNKVDLDAMKAGIEISEWFEDQARQVYRGLEENEQERDQRQLCEWIADRGGSTTSRDFQKDGPYRFRKTAKAAREALDDLVDSGLAERRKVGRRVEYHLFDSDTLGE